MNTFDYKQNFKSDQKYENTTVLRGEIFLP